MIELTIEQLSNFFKSIGPGKYHPEEMIIPFEYRSQWYLSPKQHAIEFLSYCFIYLPLFLWCWKRVKGMTTDSKALTPITLHDKILGWMMLLSYGMVAYYKFISPGSWRLPYLFQPCHVLTLFIGLTSFSRSRISQFTFQICTSLTWSSVLALVFPDMSDYEFLPDMVNYIVEHVIMLIVPCFFIYIGRFRWIHHPYWILWTYTITALYHCLILQGISMVSEVNVATLMSPPEVLSFCGEWYRPIQYVFCFTLHYAYNLFLNSFFKWLEPSHFKSH